MSCSAHFLKKWNTHVNKSLAYMNKFIKLCMFLDICVQYDFNYFKKKW